MQFQNRFGWGYFQKKYEVLFFKATCHHSSFSSVPHFLLLESVDEYFLPHFATELWKSMPSTKTLKKAAYDGIPEIYFKSHYFNSLTSSVNSDGNVKSIITIINFTVKCLNMKTLF